MLSSPASKVAWAARIASVSSCLAVVGFLTMSSTPAEAASHEDDRIVFASDRTTGPGVYNPTHDFEIFTADRDGKHAKQLTSNTANDEYPAYSPDGERIAFSTDRDGNNEVYQMGTDGSEQTDLTNAPDSDDYEPAWHPGK